MRKIICLLCALIVCLSLACPAFASANNFVPSITYKDTPAVEDTVLESKNVEVSEDVKDTPVSLKVSSIDSAKTNTAGATPAEKELVEVYEKLESGSMKLPISGEHVIRELVSVTIDQVEDSDAGKKQEEWLAQPGNCINVSFNLGVPADVDVIVMVYKDGDWTPAEKVVNNGDGTISCSLEDLGTIAFCVEGDYEVPKTGDSGMMLWVVLLVVAAAAVVVLVILRRKEHEKK